MAKSSNSAAKKVADKAAKAEAKTARKAASKQRRSQLWQAFQMQRKEDKRLLPYMIGAFVVIHRQSRPSGGCLFVLLLHRARRSVPPTIHSKEVQP